MMAPMDGSAAFILALDRGAERNKHKVAPLPRPSLPVGEGQHSSSWACAVSRKGEGSDCLFIRAMDPLHHGALLGKLHWTSCH